MPNLYIPLCALFCSILMLITFHSKRTLKTLETKLFSFMLFASFVDIVMNCIIIFFGYYNTNYPGLITILNKIDFIQLIIWVSSFSYYIFYITFKDNHKELVDNMSKIIIASNLICLVLVLLLPINLHVDGDNMFADGAAVNVLYTASGIYLLGMIACVIIGYKNILSKKYLPVYSMIALIILMMVVRKVNPGLCVIPAILCYIDLILLMTLENPDLKIIRELSNAKKQAEKYVNEKEIFSFNMSQKIKDPITDIDRICEDLEETNDINRLKEGIKDIKLSSSKIMYLVSDTLSGVSSGSMALKEEEYNVSNLFALVNQYIKTKSLKYNVNFYESKYNTDAFAIGDNLKIKQVVCSFALGLIKLIEGQSITLNTSINAKEDNVIVTFKYIIPNINLTLEELNKDEELENYDEIDFENISLNKLKKLINLLDGYIEINNIEDNKLEITINFEQKKSVIQSKDSMKYINDYENQTKAKPSILIIEDEEDISKNINHFKYDITEVKYGEDGLNMIRDGKSFGLIILNDDLQKLDTFTVFSRMQAIENFNIPVIYASNTNKDQIDSLLEKGFADVLLKPVKQKDIDEIVSKYIK